MLVRTLDEIRGGDREVFAENNNWVSARLLLKGDNMGFSFNETTIFANTETLIWYKNHLEAVYCIEGEGEVETIDDGKKYPIRPGTMYALNDHDKHYLRAFSQLRLVCVFNPPLAGREVHLPDGSYPLDEEL
ncbi:MAG: ectoine synthase [Syntrophales bacterium]|jgi:L-ectoine synthase|nr:ectoine synthase [Syntrophales bacterium]